MILISLGVKDLDKNLHQTNKNPGFTQISVTVFLEIGYLNHYSIDSSFCDRYVCIRVVL